MSTSAYQKRAFTRWANAFLRLRKIEIKDLCEDLKDGIILINLLEILSKVPIKAKYNKTIKMIFHKKENLKYAFDHMKELNIPLINIGAEDIENGNEKIILGLLWALITFFQLGSIAMDGISGKEGLLLWCQRQTQGYNEVDIQDFHRSWKSGLAFAGLLHKTDPNCLDYENLVCQQSQKIVSTVFDVAEKNFDIPQVMDVTDLTDESKPDEKIIITYLCLFFKEFARFNKEMADVASISVACDITAKHDKWISEYNSRAEILNAWINEHTARYSNVTEGKDGHGETTKIIRVNLDKFLNYKKNDRASNKAELAELNGFLNTLQTSCRNNDRPIYTPRDELTMETLKGKWDALQAQEDIYEQSLQASYIRFQYFEMLIARLEVKFTNSMEWVQRTMTEVVNKGDYGSNLSATESLLSDLKVTQQQLSIHNDVPDILDAYVKVDGLSLHRDFNACVEKVENLRSNLTTVKTGLENYAELLYISKVEFSKLVGLMKLQSWIESIEIMISSSTSTDFENDETPLDLVKTLYLLGEFEKKYTIVIKDKENELSKIIPDPRAVHAGVEDRVHLLKSLFEKINLKATAYEEKLNTRKIFLESLLEKIKAYNILAAEWALHCEEIVDAVDGPLIAESSAHVEEMITEFETNTLPKKNAADEEYAKVNTVAEELLEFPNEPDARSAFTRYSMEFLAATKEKMERIYNVRLKELKDNETGLGAIESEKEAKRQEFAKIANDHKSKLNRYYDELHSLTEGTIALEKQHERLEEMLDEIKKLRDDVDKLLPLHERLNDLGSLSNPYTSETISSLEMAGEVVKRTMEKSLQVVNVQIEMMKHFTIMGEKYHSKAQAWKDYVDEITKKYSLLSDEQGIASLGNCIETVKETLEAFNHYRSREKPKYQIEMTEISDILHELHADQKKINVSPFVPESGLDSRSLQAAWDDLSSIETKYDISIQETLIRFQRIETTFERVDTKCANLNAWLKEQVANVFADGNGFGESMSATKALIINYNLSKKQLDVLENVPSMLLKWISDASVHKDYNKYLLQIHDLEEEVSRVKELGDNYFTRLSASEREWEKVVVLLKAEEFCDTTKLLIENGQMGKTAKNIQEVDYLIEQYAEIFANKIETEKQAYEDFNFEHLTANTVDRGSVGSSSRASYNMLSQKIRGVGEKFLELETLSMEYHEALLTRKAVLSELSDKIYDFTVKASEFISLCDLQEEELKSPILADSIEAVQEEINKFDTETREKMNEITLKYTDLDKVAREIMDSEEEEADSAFNRYNLNDLYDRWTEVNNATSGREDELKDETDGLWSREHAKEWMRKEFAQKALELQAFCQDRTTRTNELSGELEEQLEYLKLLQNEYIESEMLTGMHPLNDAMEENGILVNPHTSENIFTLTAVWQALGKVYANAEAALREQILLDQGRQISPEQMKSITEVFNYFDKTGDGTLDINEFWGCCTGIGLVLAEEEVKEVFSGLDSDSSGSLTLNEFSIWMVSRLTEPGHTKGEVITAFEDISQYPPIWPPLDETPPIVPIDRVGFVFRYKPDSKKQILEECKKFECVNHENEKSFNFADFTESLFSR